jgi:hypothetical protein
VLAHNAYDRLLQSILSPRIVQIVVRANKSAVGQKKGRHEGEGLIIDQQDKRVRRDGRQMSSSDL